MTDFRRWLEIAESREPWEMTREEAMAHREALFRHHQELCQQHGGYPLCSNVPEVRASRQAIEDWPDADFHKHAVAVALAQGKPVPQEVIKSVFWKKGELERLYAHRLKQHPPKLGEAPDLGAFFD